MRERSDGLTLGLQVDMAVPESRELSIRPPVNISMCVHACLYTFAVLYNVSCFVC